MSAGLTVGSGLTALIPSPLTAAAIASALSGQTFSGALTLGGTLSFTPTNTFNLGGSTGQSTPRKAYIGNEIQIGPDGTDAFAQGVLNAQSGYLLVKAENALGSTAWPGMQFLANNGADVGAIAMRYGGGYNGTVATVAGGTFKVLNTSLGIDSNLIYGDSKNNVAFGILSAAATNATDGFVYIPTCAGTPSGTPTAIAGKVPFIYDTTNNQFWIYAAGGWKQPRTPLSAAVVTWQ